MKQISILDPRFRYVSSICTDVAITWRRFGFKVGHAGQPHSGTAPRGTARAPLEPEMRVGAHPRERSDTLLNSVGKSARC